MVSFKFTFDPAISLEQRVAFELAGLIWKTYLTDNVTVNIYIASTNDLEGGAVGGAIPIFQNQLYGVYQAYAAADATASSPGSALSTDTQALASLQSGNTISLLSNGQVISGNTDILLTSAQAKALGMSKALLLSNGNYWSRNLVDANATDGYILVNQSYQWGYDFLRQQTAASETLDFLSMALHEIGHIMGFVSGIESTIKFQTLYSGNTEVDNFTVLDLFRHSSNSTAISNSTGAVTDVSAGGNSYFSINGGKTNLGDFSTGQKEGDGYQASHWKRLKDAMGIMDPTLAYQERMNLSYLDLQAFDVLGWDVNYVALKTGINLQELLVKAESAVMGSLGLSGNLLTDSRGQDHLYKLGYSQWWQIFEGQIQELGYGKWWQIFEKGYQHWEKAQEGNIQSLSYGKWWQQFEGELQQLGYGKWWQQFEGEMQELGYGQWWQLFELGYGKWWQQLETFFSKLDTVEGNAPVAPTQVTGGQVGGSVHKVYKGGAEDDILAGTDSQDRIEGGAGDDFIDGRAGHDVLWGDAGKDIIYGFDGNDFLRGGLGDDLLLGENGNDELFGDDGNDVLSGGEGEDLLSGGNGRDELKGGWGRDVLAGDEGDDLLNGEDGNDVLVGGDGNDQLDGGNGNDVIYGDRTSPYTTENLLALKQQAITQSASTANITPTATPAPSVLNPIRLEAEKMTLSGQYEIKDLNGDSGSSVRSIAPVVGKSTFTGPSGKYMVLVRYLDNANGNGILNIDLNGKTLDQWTLDKNDERFYIRTVAASVTLNTGDSISFTTTPSAAAANGLKDNAFIDYIELVPLASLVTVTLDSTTDGIAPTAANSTTAAPTPTGAGVLRIQAESMTLAGEYVKETATFASGGSLIGVSNAGTGIALTSFTGETGFYNIVLGYYDENDLATAQIKASLNDDELDSWQLNRNLGGITASADNFLTRTLAQNVLLNQGDIFKLTGIRSVGSVSDEHARVDYVDFIKVSAPLTKAGTVAPQPLNNGLVGHWKFDEVIGSHAVDSVGSAHATLIDTEAEDWTDGAIGNSLSLDGGTERAVIKHTSALNVGANNSDFSVAFWFQLEAGPNGQWRSVIHKGNTGQERGFSIWLHPDSNKIHYRISTSANWNEGGNSNTFLKEKQWYHIAYVKSGNQLSLYLDGKKDSGVTLLGTSLGNSGPITVGGIANNVDGAFDDLRIYNQALSAANISELASTWQPGGFDDTLKGGEGNDVLHGGIGRDILYGDQQDSGDSSTFRGAQFFDGKAYLLSKATQWQTAQTEAKQLGGNLVTINSQAEEKLLQDRFGKANPFWIGINDVAVEGQWKWASGEAVTYTNWVPGGPDNFNGNQDYGQLNFYNGQWDDNGGVQGGSSINGQWVEATTYGIIELAASHDDALFGGSGDDAIYGNLGNDYLYGESLAASLNEGLVARWTFDESSGLTRSDDTGRHPGTLVSATNSSTWTAGKINGSLEFGAGISQMRVADTAALDITRQITLSSWINVDVFQDWDGLITKGVNNAPYSWQIMADGSLRFEVNHATGGERLAWKSAGKLQANKWQHVAVTYDGEAVRFYIDGQLDANVSYATFKMDTNNEDLVLGADLPGSDEFFDGKMDETRIYNRALSTTEIAELAKTDRTTFEYKGSTYLLTSKAQTWTEAQAEAVRLGGNLVTINDAQEENWLHQTFGWSEIYWTGLTDQVQEGNWQWASGEAVTFTNWAPGEPNNSAADQDYASFNAGAGKGQWDDAGDRGNFQWNGSQWIWREGIKGIIEIKPPEESQNDVMIGGVGNDTLVGGDGDDILNGSDSVAAGFRERDQLIGGKGADTYVLGDYRQAYYQGALGNDYALIKGFDASDVVQLHGSAANYSVLQQGADVLLYRAQDLVAIFEQVSSPTAVLSQARFV
jgi:Ca2+-binding RTX toxin-like protein